MKQMILLLVAVYSLILNQSSKHSGNKNQETGKIKINSNSAAGKIDPRPQTTPPVRKNRVMFTKSNYFLYEETNSAR